MNYSAGKITIATTLTAFFVFLAVFLLDIGSKDQFQTVSAQGTATTSLTVRNLPPIWQVEAFEQTPSATNTPINTGDVVVWEAQAQNNLPYWLIICSTDDPAVPVDADNTSEVGDQSNAPSCAPGATLWAISTSTPSEQTAIATLTTSNDDTTFNESNEWYAFVCDADVFDPRCSEPVQGAAAADPDAASPFVLNFRPILTSVSNDSPVLPGGEVTFFSSSTDPNTLRGNDDIFLHVCSSNAFSNGSCDEDTFASSSVAFTEDAEAVLEIDVPAVAYTYQTFLFIVDEFNHVAEDSFQSNFDVANATPIVLPGEINLNSGDPMQPDNALATTSGFTLSFDVSSDNSCVAVDGSGASLGAGSEFADIIASVYRDSVGTTTCDGSEGAFNSNNCYTSGAAAEWDFVCEKDVSSCDDQGTETTSMSVTYNCTFSIWNNADPTDGDNSTEVQFPNDVWQAAVSVVDAAGATSTFTEGVQDTVDMISYAGFDLGTSEIGYGSLEPGENTGNLIATTTILATGNTGIDQQLEGSSMCTDIDLNTINDATGYGCLGNLGDTIPSSFQQFGFENTVAYGSGTALTPGNDVLATVGVFKPTVIGTATDGDIYWGIEVPSDITLAGAYTGLNSFVGVASDANTWD